MKEPKEFTNQCDHDWYLIGYSDDGICFWKCRKCNMDWET